MDLSDGFLSNSHSRDQTVALAGVFNPDVEIRLHRLEPGRLNLAVQKSLTLLGPSGELGKVKTGLRELHLGLMVDADSPNYIWRFFCRLTDPVFTVLSVVTPRAVPPALLWLFGFVWMFWLRVVFHYTLLLFNLAPKLAGAAS